MRIKFGAGSSILLLCFFFSLNINPLQKKYTTANAHSHNDYEQQSPFVAAYGKEFGSIEVDVFLQTDTSLFVAHHLQELTVKKRRLDSLYFIPLVSAIRKNNGSVYSDRKRNLQLMIDLKTEAVSTLKTLIGSIRKYPELINTPTLKIVISGNRPDISAFASYPSFIWFDGNLGTEYSKKRFPESQ